MAIRIGGTSIIDDNKNIANVGIITVGISGTSGTFKVGTGVTIDGAGNAYFDGYITVNGGINYLVGLNSIFPQDAYLENNSIYDGWDGNLLLYFDSNVQVAAGSTLKAEIRKGTSTGGIVTSVGITSIAYPGSDLSVLRISFGGISTAPVSTSTTYFPIIPKGIIKFIASNNDYAGNYSGDAQQNTFSLKLKGTPGGTSYGGGYLICAASGISWVVAPCTAEVSKNWHSRNDANTAAQSVSGCTGWFVPTVSQLQNPGYICRTYWDNYRCANYWSSSQRTVNFVPDFAYWVNFSNGIAESHGGGAAHKNCTYCVRSFRCVAY